MTDAEKLKQIRRIVAKLLLVPSMVTGKPRPVKNTTKQECYDALFAIQEMLETRSLPVLRKMAQEEFEAYDLPTDEAMEQFLFMLLGTGVEE